MTWLTVLQFANYLIPLLIIPYIVRVLGTDIFGKVSYAQNIISYFTLIINFGFEYSATREIAINKESNEKLTHIFWNVLIQKTLLLFISFIGLIFLFFYVPKVNSDFNLYFFVFLMNVGIVLFPTWFYQGTEEIGKMAVFNILIKGLGLALTVFLVKSSSDYLIYPLITSITYIIIGIFALFYLIKSYKLYPKKINIKLDFNILTRSLPIFANNLFISLYTIANITILGIYFTDYEVGIYTGYYKIIMAILLVTSMPFNTSVFPKISSEFEKSKKNGMYIFKKIVFLVSIAGLVICIITFLMSNFLVSTILGNQFLDNIRIMKYFSILPLLVILASAFTVQGLYGMQLQKYAPYIGFFIGTISILINFTFIPKYGIDAAALSWIFSQLLEIIIVGTILSYQFKKFKHEN